MGILSPVSALRSAILLTGDSIDHVVTWKGQRDISGIGETVAIRIQMFQAKLFAYRV